MDPLRLTSFKTIFRSFREILPCFWKIENHLYISGKTTKSSEASRASGSGELWQSYQWRNQREGTHQDEPEGIWWLQRVRPGGLSVVWKVKHHLKRESPIRFCLHDEWKGIESLTGFESEILSHMIRLDRRDVLVVFSFLNILQRFYPKFWESDRFKGEILACAVEH